MMINFNFKQMIKKMTLLCMLIGAILTLGVSPLSKEKLMTDKKLPQLYEYVNSSQLGKSENQNLPNRNAIVEGKEMELRYLKSFVYDNTSIPTRHMFETTSGETVLYSGDSKGAYDWDGFSLKPDSTNKLKTKLTVEERIKSALEYANQYLNTEGYVLRQSIQSKIDFIETDCLNLTFVKKINGYETTDLFYICVYEDGQIISFDKKRYGEMDDVDVPEIDSDMLQKVVSEYVTKLHGDFNKLVIDEERSLIRLDKEGVPIIQLEVHIEKTLSSEDPTKSTWKSFKIPVYCDDVKANK